MSAKPSGVAAVKTVHAAAIARVHTYLAFTAFLSALGIGCLLHYKKIVKNGVAGYPEEWFPSVSATIGDWFPERNIFQVLIAITSGPRFALTYLQYCVHSSWSQNSSFPGFVFFIGVLRTLACGGWVFVPSYEAHDFHDIAMIAYIVLNIPWMFGSLASSRSPGSRRRRKWISSAFFGSLVPLVYFFIQHKVQRIPGAYTRYAFFEWALIFLDILYDSAAEQDFSSVDLQIAIGPSLSAKGIAASATNDVSTRAGIQHVNGSTAENIATAPAVIAATAATKDELSALGRASRSALAPLLEALFASKERHAILTFASDVYLSYIFWTLYTALAPSFFYYSVWQLGVAGHELTLLTTLTPALLSSSTVFNWASNRSGRTTLWAISFAGIACYVSRFPLVRMLCVGVANASLALGKAVDWSDPSKAGYEGLLIGLGLVLSSLSKHANHSNNPVWPILDERSGGWNKTGLFLAVLALYECYTRPQLKSAVPSEKNGRVETAAVPPKSINTPKEPWLPIGLALGSLLFTLHQLLADSSTLIAWSWTGYPITGPVPNLHGAITLVAQTIGLLIPLGLGTFFGMITQDKGTLTRVDAPSTLLGHPAWFSFGAASAYTLYAYEDWTSYAGGLAFAVFLMSITPSVLHRAAIGAQPGSIHKVFFTAWLTVSVLDFVSVMTVAYAFVPGAQIFRERTNFVLATQLLLLLPAFKAPRPQWPELNLPTSSSAAYMRNFLALTSVLAVVATLYRMPTTSPQPYRPGPRIIRAGIWTVHFGIDDEGRDSQRRMRDLIKDMELDVVGLLETDLHRIPYGNRDLTRVISEELGFHVDLGPGPNKHTWGAVLLSKYPILKTTHHLLPSPHGELAPAIEAILDVYGTEVVVIVSHNGQEEDPLDRELQSKELARIMASHETRPVIFLGYVVTKPKALRPDPYQILVEDGKMHDIDHDDWDRWCEYILYRGLYRTSYARISRSTITDTELQVGQWVLPKHGFNVTDDGPFARYLRSHKESLPVDHWFPMEYYGNEQEGGQRGHFYHVFNTPLYYQLPEGAIV